MDCLVISRIIMIIEAVLNEGVLALAAETIHEPPIGPAPPVDGEPQRLLGQPGVAPLADEAVFAPLGVRDGGDEQASMPVEALIAPQGQIGG